MAYSNESHTVPSFMPCGYALPMVHYDAALTLIRAVFLSKCAMRSGRRSAGTLTAVRAGGAQGGVRAAVGHNLVRKEARRWRTVHRKSVGARLVTGRSASAR